MKLIVMIFGLTVGFGVGVWWGVHHPMQAATLSQQEEAQFIKTAEDVQARLNAVLAHQAAASGGSSIPVPGSSFAGGSSVASSASAPDPQLQSLAQQMQQQLDSMKAKVNH